MKKSQGFFLATAAFAAATLLLVSSAPLSSQQGATVNIDNDDIGGVVSSAKGPEAGVWVIAETSDLPTRFARMVVTDDRGRYVLPDLPKASYSVWVRGYGLVDSPKVKATPGKNLNLKAVVAPNDAAAAHYYPAIYWYSMLKIPDGSEFGGKGKIPAKITQNRMGGFDERQWLRQLPSAWDSSPRVLSRKTFRIRLTISRLLRKPGFAESSPARAAKQCLILPSTNLVQLHCAILPIGPTASPKASCLTPSRRDRKESNVT